MYPRTGRTHTCTHTHLLPAVNLSKFELLIVEGDHVRGLAQPVRGRKGERREREGREGRGRRRREEGEREKEGKGRGRGEEGERKGEEGHTSHTHRGRERGRRGREGRGREGGREVGKIRETQMKYPTSRRLRDLSTLSQDWGVARPRIHNYHCVCMSTNLRYSHHGRGKESRETWGTSGSELSWEVCHEDTREQTISIHYKQHNVETEDVMFKKTPQVHKKSANRVNIHNLYLTA